MTAHRLLYGDAIAMLRTLEANSVHAVVTDPPYEIGFLGAAWDSSGVAFSPELWAELLRVLKPGGRVLCFAMPRRYHRVACAAEDAGFEVQDLIPWLKGGANMPKGGHCSPSIDKHLGAERRVVGSRVLSGTAALSVSERGGTHSVGVSSIGAKKEIPITESATELAKLWEGWAWNLKPSNEPIGLFRKPTDGSAVASLVKWGTGPLNIGACGVGEGRAKRWPPNAMLSQDSAEALAAQSGETKCAGNKRGTKSDGAFHGAGKQVEWSSEQVNKGDSGCADRYFPTFRWERKANRSEKTDSCPVTTVKPIPLIEWLVKLVTPPGGIVLDPFAGSGTIFAAATLVGCSAIGIESSAEHVKFY